MAGPITLDTPLGSALTFRSMRGFEGLSQPFVYELDVMSNRSDVNPVELLDEPVSVHLDLPQEEGHLRHWNGRVVHFQYLSTDDDGWSHYRLTLRPWLWQLKLSTDCRVFQKMSVPEIVTQVFRNRGFEDFELVLSDSYPQREYVVQYDESDFQFVSRLLEREGIYYFFRHEDGKHTLAMADYAEAHSPAPGCDSLPFATTDTHRNSTLQYVRRWSTNAHLEAGAYAHADFDFTKPRVPLYARQRSADDLAKADLGFYEHPGGFASFAAGESYARLRLEQVRRDVLGCSGDTNARGLTVGANFQLLDHPREDQNRTYLVISARYRLRGHDVRTSQESDQETFGCTFNVIDAKTTFRPPLSAPNPSVRGPQTATVVGPGGQEIWTDQYGRVKVQFHWDRQGQNDQNSSCWVRAAQAWAGANWGSIHVPRIGQEVIVDFLDGDPDRPIITGRVYNASNMPPYQLPQNQSQSGIKSRSTPRGWGSNEIRFEDARGLEDLYIHAQGTQTTVVERDKSLTVGGNESVSIAGAETRAVLHGRSTTVTLADSLTVMGTAATAIAGDYVEHVGGALRTSVGGEKVDTISQNLVLEVGKDSLTRVSGISTLEVGGPLRVVAAGSESRTTGGAVEVRVGKQASYLYAAEASTVVGHPEREAASSTYVYGPGSVTTTKDLLIESKTSVVIQCGDTKVEITPDGVKIIGKAIALNGGSEIDLTSPSASLTLDSDVTLVGTKLVASSSGATLALDSVAKLSGAQVQLGSGSGQSESSSQGQKKNDDQTKPVFIRMKLIRNGKPAAAVPYTLTLDNTTQLSGSTTGAGLVEKRVPATVASVLLTFLDTGESHTFNVGTLEPVDTIVGAQKRLKRIGYYHGLVDGTAGSLLTHALEAFQKANGLSVSGSLDSATQGALTKAYGS